MRVLPGPGRAAVPRPPRSPRSGRPKPPKAPSFLVRARRLVNAGVNPQLAAINADYNRQQAAGTQTIKDWTDAVVRQLAGVAPQLQQIYAQAQAQQGSADQALNDRLGQASGAVASDVAHQLEAAGQNAPAFAAPLAANASGSAAANLGMGTASRSELIGEGANAAAYGAKLPGIGAQGGLQRLGSFENEIATNRAHDVGAITAQVPKEILDEEQALRTAAFNNRIARQSGLLKQQQAAQDAAYKRATLGLRAQSQAEHARHDVATEGLTEQQIQARVTRANQVLADRNASAAAKHQATREKAFYSTREKAVTRARQLYRGASTSSGGGGFAASVGAAGHGKSGRQPIPYGKAYRELWLTYSPELLTQYGFRPAAVRRMIAHSLVAAGYSRPSQPRATGGGTYATGRKARG